MGIKSTSFRLNQIVQARPSKSQSQTTVTNDGTKISSPKKSHRVAARKSSGTASKKNNEPSRARISNSATPSSRMTKNVVKKKRRKSAKEAKPTSFGGSSARVTKQKTPNIRVVSTTYVSSNTTFATTQPLSHKKITLG